MIPDLGGATTVSVMPLGPTRAYFLFSIPGSGWVGDALASKVHSTILTGGREGLKLCCASLGHVDGAC